VYKNLIILILFISLISVSVQARVVDSIKVQLPKDTIARIFEKAVAPAKIVSASDSAKLKVFKPNPGKVVWMATIIPGYGQILNKKYWKLPLVYGGFLGCAYAISWNSNQYNSYKNAYLDLYTYNHSDINYKNAVDKNKANVSFYQILPKGYTIADFQGYTEFEKTLKTRQDFYRRYRDLSIIATIGYYALTIIDAYVDAQLYDFDISPDLSMRVQPALIKNGSGNNTFAMQCNISF
jgi:hypothetical protein